SKASWGGEGFFGLHFKSLFIIEGRQGRDLEAGADEEAMEGCCIVPCLLLMACSYRTQDHQLRGGTTLSHQLLMKKMSYWLAYSLML
ncbi:mCG145147, partial [Mus musculus]